MVKRYYCLKLFVVLLFWALVFLFIQKWYNDSNPFIDQNNQMKRANWLASFLKKHNFIRDPEQNIMEIFDLLTDKSVLNEDKLISAIESELPSIPIRYWYNKSKEPQQKSSNCSKFPSILDLHYHNKYWQKAPIRNFTIHLYNAYYDTRKDLKAGPVVRVLAMTSVYWNKFPVYCQLWYDETSEPTITTSANFLIFYPSRMAANTRFTPKHFTCPTTDSSRIPKAVSLVANRCDNATNAVRVHYDVPIGGKQKFAVCIKGMSFLEDFSVRLVEWIELQLLLGASKIFLYQLSVHPNVTKVLEHYAKRGLVDFRSTTFANGDPNTRFLQAYTVEKQYQRKLFNEQIVYNDCFNRNLYRYEYISIQDLDEVLMPVGKFTNWSQIMEIATTGTGKNCRNGYSSYCFKHYHISNWIPEYATNIPTFMHMLQRVQRQKRYWRSNSFNTKCFHRTERTIMMHNHLSWKYLNVCQAYYFNPNVARLHHYRRHNVGRNTTVDLSVRRFQNELLNRSLDALRTMGFLTIQKYTQEQLN